MIEIEAPEEYLCPLTLDVMADPVMSKYGQSFERSEILQWLKSGHGVCPLSRRPLSLQDLVTNHALRLKISEWRKERGDEENIVIKRSSSQIYGFITLPSKDDDNTDRTIDEEEDLFYIQLASLSLGRAVLQGNNAMQQPQTDADAAATRRRRRRQRRASTGSSRSPQEGRQRSIRRPLRGLRNLFSGSSP